MIDFSISTIRIRNFKGMRDFKIDIPIGKLMAIIGQNNSGKSNLLEAIVLCLSPKEFSTHQIKQSDFWHSKDGMAAEFLDIEAKFTATPGSKLPVLRDNNGQLVEVRGVKLYAEIDNLESDQYLIDEKGERIFWGRKYATPKDIQQWLPEVWFLSPDTLERDYDEWKKRHLSKLLKIYKDEFLASSAGGLIKEYSELKGNSLKTKYWTDKVEPKLKKEMSFFSGHNDRPIIEPGLVDLDNWFWNGLTMNVIPEDEWPAIEHQQLGKGWKSLLRLVALKGARQVTEKGKKVILCVDEPEAFLTPFKQRKLRQCLNLMAKKMDQVIIATHSNQMISDQFNQKIVRLKMTKKGVEKREFDGKMAKEMMECGGEALFGSSVVFDMSKSNNDWQAKIDWDAHEAVLIKHKDINRVKLQAGFAQGLGIEWCLITESDEEITLLEKQQSLYDKIIDVRKSNNISELVENWLESEWRGKEVLVLK